MPPTEPFGQADSLELTNLIPRYRSGTLSPEAVLTEVLRRVEVYPDPAVWISRVQPGHVLACLHVSKQKQKAGISQPLSGIPFAVKDNIDVEGQPTTAACSAFGYFPARSATVVQRLCDAGAIVIGKTNLDQFATGLVGTRSPYGSCRNVFNEEYISGGSSSGSAVAVAGDLVSFSLGTDTAGSGRVPAAFNNLVGLKPSCGRLSTAGVVPACQSLDCVSIFTHGCDEASMLLKICEGFDPADPYSKASDGVTAAGFGPDLRFGVLSDADREFFGDDQASQLYDQAVLAMRKLGGRSITTNFSLFEQTAALLYSGPWVAERSLAALELLKANPDALHPVTRGILEAGLKVSGIEVFDGLHRLAALRAQVARQWKDVDFLLLPTTGTIYSVKQVLEDPLTTNTNLGRYTNFVNLLDLCAVSVPAGFRPSGLPMGVSLIAPAGNDNGLLAIGSRLHKAILSNDCTTPVSSSEDVSRIGASNPPGLKLAVVGAHLSGMPLNHQLTGLGATLVRACRTARQYRLYALPGTSPPKPGLIRVGPDKGVAIDLEIWELESSAFAKFVAAIPGPLGIGSILMDDSSVVQGFLCEAYGVTDAPDISHLGGWRAYVASTQDG